MPCNCAPHTEHLNDREALDKHATSNRKTTDRHYQRILRVLIEYVTTHLKAALPTGHPRTMGARTSGSDEEVAPGVTFVTQAMKVTPGVTSVTRAVTVTLGVTSVTQVVTLPSALG